MPSIIEGLFAGRAGIQAHGTAIAVLADNISNQNTIGFKQSRPDFKDLLAGTLTGTASIQPGSGVQVGAVTQLMSQGTFEYTGRGLDVGIDGAGFLVVQDPNSGARYYTRAGNLHVDTEGVVRDQNNYTVLGFRADGAGGLQSLNVNQREEISVSTNEVTIAGNLDANSDLLTGGAAAIPDCDGTNDFTALANAAEFSTFVDVYDSLGQQHTITIYFFHTAANEWVARAVANAGEITAGGPPATNPPPGFDATDPYAIAGDITLQFASNGVRSNTGNPDATIAVQWSNGSSQADIDLTFDPFTQYSSASTVTSIYQDGTGSGSVVGFSIDENGTLFASLDNGQNANIGVMALAIFSNAEGMQRVGNSLFVETSSSGEPVIGKPNTGTFGRLEAGALEQSTADLAADFVKLISLQRGFQGSSRVIQNIDDLLNEIINLA